MTFFERLESLARGKGTCLCVGLDPRIDPSSTDPVAAIVSANRRIIEATAPFAAAFKPNAAFYEAFGAAGHEALVRTLAAVPDGIPVILDAKRCDIDSTAEAYARAIFGLLGADAATLSPYMGKDAVDPFLKYEGKGLFILCRTSNRGAGAFQDIAVAGPGGGPEPLYLAVARECSAWSPSIGLVVAGNDVAALRAVREAAPEAWFLAPGVGAQGGSAREAFEAGMRPDGLGVLVVAARSVADAKDPAAAARKLRDDMNQARDAAAGGERGPARRSGSAGPSGSAGDGGSLKARFLRALLDTGCFKLGDFVLKSGKRSPFYVDLRRLVSDPAAMDLAAAAYASAAADLPCDRIAGIPAAGLPLASAACSAMRKPMVWPRMPVKEHGTGNKVEGAFAKGDRVLLLDDLITTGSSKLEAAEILRGEGLVVERLVVLLERGRRGRADMAGAGIELRAFAHVRELFAVCEAAGLIDAARRSELEAYVDAE